ncbi:cytochrome C assembly family protein [Crenobacter luteus]|uniref:Cytochrome C biogenesis protein n=1 Tax=Crenobacter luteus TaxID=1452487 RepID=A0A163CDC6_9NEIS|nr:cytochrome c biogenesis protein CcsA [Crenobacter luteus]KZE31515.1 cytochrome C biogenesis protein [Crenobacter luteus]
MTAYTLSLSLFLIAAYAGFSWHYFGQWRGVAGWPQRAHLEQGLLGAVLLAHAWLLFSPWLLPGPAVLGVGQALSMVMWLMLLIYWTGRFFYRLDGLPVFILPFAALAVLAALLLPGRPIPHQLYTPDFALHLIVSMLAYSLLAIGALLALLMLVLERALHAKRRTPAMRNLPPLLSLEQLMFQAIGWGFALLTLSLASGVLFSEQLFGVAAVVNHKIVFGVLSWLLFGALLVGRRRHGWRGRLAVRWTLASFALLLFAYIGSKVVLELILHRV